VQAQVINASLYETQVKPLFLLLRHFYPKANMSVNDCPLLSIRNYNARCMVLIYIFIGRYFSNVGVRRRKHESTPMLPRLTAAATNMCWIVGKIAPSWYE
jgi:hypothetical protein